MKITKVEPLPVGSRDRTWVFVRVCTDEDIVGLGEATLERHPQAVIGAIKDLEPLIEGHNPTHIEHLWQSMYRDFFWRGGPVKCSAISGIEQALWDIAGKALGVPVYRLIGGKYRNKVRMYANFWSRGSTDSEEVADLARKVLAMGYSALKLSIPLPSYPVRDTHVLRQIVAVIKSLREAVGDDVDLMFDAHGRLDPSMAIQVGRALEPYGLTFIEEPVLPEDIDPLAEVARQIPIPVATGERLFGKWSFRDLLERRCVRVVQPDISHCGGIFEARKIAAMAESYFVAVAPHNPLSPVNTVVSLHLDTCIPNFLMQEVLVDGDPLRDKIIDPPLVIHNGYAVLSDAPGWGIELNEEEARINPPKPIKFRLYRTEDGSIADP